MRNSESGRKRVLIVDDEEQIRTILKRYLEQSGYEVAGESSDGNEAIQMAARLQPDIVLLDNEMPVLNGEDAAGRIRATSKGARIVAVSGALTSQPVWSDAFLNKTGLSMVGAVLDVLP